VEKTKFYKVYFLSVFVKKKSLVLLKEYILITIIIILFSIYTIKVLEGLYKTYKESSEIKQMKLFAYNLDEYIKESIKSGEYQGKIYVPDGLVIKYSDNILIISYKNKESVELTENCLIKFASVPTEGGYYEIRIITTKGECKIDINRIS